MQQASQNIYHYLTPKPFTLTDVKHFTNSKPRSQKHAFSHFSAKSNPNFPVRHAWILMRFTRLILQWELIQEVFGQYPHHLFEILVNGADILEWKWHLKSTHSREASNSKKIATCWNIWIHWIRCDMSLYFFMFTFPSFLSLFPSSINVRSVKKRAQKWLISFVLLDKNWNLIKKHTHLNLLDDKQKSRHLDVVLLAEEEISFSFADWLGFRFAWKVPCIFREVLFHDSRFS